ncbi:hypothetical protein ACX27_27430 [Nostoc piscinale CENA21]|uniref:Uncharacterized protein n=1 Tax=Nostoc piscinale CENA21 TaxID=224013 RepID=A0A0M4SVI8_9NOSO|nr:hypothetical protein [Nostoc piscinale]ALF55740.1 hypothetical protein ACX27_27430 [Nostoc piscinale CENA21]
MSTLNAIDLAELISKSCSVSLMSDRVLIICDRHEDYAVLLRQEDIIKQALNFIINRELFQINWVTIGIKDTDTRHSIKVMEHKTELKIITLNDDLITECLNYNGACGIVRMSDHKGLFSNELITFSSQSHPNDWVGKNMADFWFDDELEKYVQRLSQDGELRNYSYVAKMMDGRVARLTVDARIVSWRGELARIVKTINREFLS